jgi:hypothetical protein
MTSAFAPENECAIVNALNNMSEDQRKLRIILEEMVDSLNNISVDIKSVRLLMERQDAEG